jgi:hypothetical protein
VTPQPALRISSVILTITLTVILISSSIIAVYSPSPIALSGGFASATSENSGGEESNTGDATTDDGEEEKDRGDNVQGEDAGTEEQQEQLLPSPFTQQGEEEDQEGAEEGEEEEQLAFMGGEICNDFEDNDGDGWIDLADPDCGAAAGPATQGALTAPTTPPPSASTTNATNSTINTLTSGLIGLPSLPATPQPPTTTTTTPQGGEQEPVQQPQSEQQVPGTTSPDSSSASGTTTFLPDGISITKGPDSGVSATIPDSRVRIYSDPNGVHTIVHPTGHLYRGSDGSVNLKLPNAEHISLSPDGTGEISLEDGDTTITGNRDGTLTIEKPYVDPNTGVGGASITTTYKAH